MNVAVSINGKKPGLDSAVIKSLRQPSFDRISKPGRLLVTARNKWILIKVSEIVFMRADSNYTIFTLKSGDRIVGSKTLKHYQEIINRLDAFIRVHQSFLINADYLLSFDFSRGLFLEGVVEYIPVSRSRREEVLAYFREVSL
jgi:two-component system LytT family response regulator